MHETVLQPKLATAAAKPEDLVARARELVPELTARRQTTRRDRRVAAEVIRTMTDAGFFRVLQPARWGGYEMDPGTFYEIQRGAPAHRQPSK